MPTVKLHIPGTTQTHGYTDHRLTKAVIRGIVTGLVDNRNIEFNAINATAVAAGSRHHNIPSLPIASITATRFGRTKALVSIFYQYSRFRNPLQFPAFTLVRSYLNRDGAHYEVLAEYPLQQPKRARPRSTEPT